MLSVSNAVGNAFICKKSEQTGPQRVKEVLLSPSTYTTILGATGIGKVTRAGKAIYGGTMATFDAIFSYEKGAFEPKGSR